jgi:hypothetical protein
MGLRISWRSILLSMGGWRTVILLFRGLVGCQEKESDGVCAVFETVVHGQCTGGRY